MPIYALDDQAPDLPPPSRFWIAPDAHVMGRVRLAADVSVWFGAVLRGDNEWIEIGEGSNVQEGCMLHTDMGFPMTIGAGVTIGHHAILHGCTVGAGSLIGMGATLLNGSRIGPGCLVGARSLVTEGKTFPDNSLIVGSPARAVRELNPAALADLQRAAGFYVSNHQRFAAKLRRLD